MERIKGFIKCNKVYLSIILVITIVVILYTCIELGVIFKNSPNNNEVYEINYDDTNLNINNTLGYLKNITSEYHPMFTDGNINTMKKITNYLDKFGILYEIQDDIVSTADFEIYYQNVYESFKELLLNNPESNPNHFTDLNEYFKWEGYFKDFDDYFIQITNRNENKNYQSIEEYRLDYEKNHSKKSSNINNIIAHIGEIDENKNSIVFSVHYDAGEEEGNTGASDNGMNVAALLESVRLLKDKKYENNVYIVFVNGEETGFLGSNIITQKERLKNVKVILNFDNKGAGGNLIPWRYTNNALIDKYLKAVSKPHGYIINGYLQGIFANEVNTDYKEYSKKYDVIDFALFMDNKNYHTENDSFENINIKSLNETTKTMYELIEYFGNDKDNYVNEDIWFMELDSRLILKLSSSIYNLLLIVLMFLSLVYLWYLLYKKQMLSMIINSIYIIMCIVIYFVLKEYTIILLIPVLFNVIGFFIKNNEIRKIYDMVSYSIVLHLISYLIIQFISLKSIFVLIYIIPLLYLINIYQSFAKKIKNNQ